jgi:chaperonin GroEL
MAKDLDEQYFDQMLGTASVVTITSHSTIIMGGDKDKKAVNTIVDQIDRDLMDKKILPAEKARLGQRRAKLKGGVAVIEVGAGSEIDMKEKKDRIDDAKEAVVSALEEGVVIGGGCALLNARSKTSIKITNNEDFEKGIELLFKAVEAPLRTIVKNSGGSPDVVIDGVLGRPIGTGYNAKTGQYVEMFTEGIVDPKKVTRIALQSAASVAGTLLTTQCGLIPKQ